MAPDLLTAAQVAEIARVTPATVYSWATRGLLRGRRLGGPHGHWRFRRDDVLAFIEGESSDGGEE